MKDSELLLNKCQECNPLKDGWCKEVEVGNGLMLDEKCPRVGAFVQYIMSESYHMKERRANQ